MRILIIIVVVLWLGVIVRNVMKQFKQIDNRKEKRYIPKVSEAVVILPQENDSFFVMRGKELQYSAKVHTSVGIEYKVEYDLKAFKLETKKIYDKPEEVRNGLAGGDSAVMKCVFIPLKSGKYTIKIIHKFRGEIEKIITYKISVK